MQCRSPKEGSKLRTKHTLPDGTPFTQEGLRSKGWQVDVTHWRLDKGDFTYAREVLSLVYDKKERREAQKKLLDSVVQSKKALRDKRSPVAELQIWPKGGKTVVSITNPEGSTFVETAYCSLSDNYRDQIGYAICMGRLAKQTGNLRRGRRN